MSVMEPSTRMKLGIGSLVVVLAVLGGGCSGDSDSALSDDQRTAVDDLIESSAERGIEYDEGCLGDVIRDLSSNDVAKLADDEREQMSAAGAVSLSTGLIPCMSEDSQVMFVVESMSENGVVADEDCVRETLERFEFDDILGDAEAIDEFNDALLACETTGSE